MRDDERTGAHPGAGSRLVDDPGGYRGDSAGARNGHGQATGAAMAAGLFDQRSMRARGDPPDDHDLKRRLRWLRRDHPAASLITEHIRIDDTVAVFKATISLPAGGAATGYASARAQDAGDFVERAETAAVGRALDALGYLAPAVDLGDEFAVAPAHGGQPMRPTEPPAPAGWTTNGMTAVPAGSTPAAYAVPAAAPVAPLPAPGAPMAPVAPVAPVVPADAAPAAPAAAVPTFSPPVHVPVAPDTLASPAATAFQTVPSLASTLEGAQSAAPAGSLLSRQAGIAESRDDLPPATIERIPPPARAEPVAPPSIVPPAAVAAPPPLTVVPPPPATANSAAADSAAAAAGSAAEPALEDYSFSQFWRWARGLGYNSKGAIEELIGRPIKDLTPLEVRGLVLAARGET